MNYSKVSFLTAMIALGTCVHGNLISGAADFPVTEVRGAPTTTPASPGDGPGWSTWLEVFDTASGGYKYNTGGWDNTNVVVTAPGSATMQFHPGWTDNGAGPLDLGDTMVMSFYTELGSTGSYIGETVSFTGNLAVGDALAGANPNAFAFIKVLDSGFAEMITPSQIGAVDANGAFELQADIPSAGVNVVQFGFTMANVAGAAGTIDFSNLSVTVVPEPSTYALILGLGALGFLAYRRRK